MHTDTVSGSQRHFTERSTERGRLHRRLLGAAQPSPPSLAPHKIATARAPKQGGAEHRRSCGPPLEKRQLAPERATSLALASLPPADWRAISPHALPLPPYWLLLPAQSPFASRRRRPSARGWRWRAKVAAPSWAGPRRWAGPATPPSSAAPQLGA